MARYAAGGGAAAAAVAATAFALLGMREAGKLEPREGKWSPVKRSEAQRFADHANQYYALAGVSAAAGLALGGATAYLFYREEHR